jgi:hypothetical protein
MIEAAIHFHRNRGDRVAHLFLNDIDVGIVLVQSHNSSWGFGEFLPNPAFSDFATAFGMWSLLMHAENDGERLSEAASEELRGAEYAIDTLRAKLRLEQPEEWRPVRQVNIDGVLIEWKE